MRAPECCAFVRDRRRAAYRPPAPAPPAAPKEKSQMYSYHLTCDTPHRILLQPRCRMYRLGTPVGIQLTGSNFFTPDQLERICFVNVGKRERGFPTLNSAPSLRFPTIRKVCEFVATIFFSPPSRARARRA